MKILNLLYLVSIFSFATIAAADKINCEQITIESISPESARVAITAASGTIRNAQAGSSLLPGDQIETKTEMIVDLRICDGSAIRLDSNTVYKFTSINKEETAIAWLFELHNGGIRAVVTPSVQKDFIKFRVASPSGSVGVRGTEFYVSYKPETDQTSLFTLDGKVLFGKKEALGKLAHFSSAKLGEDFLQVEKNMASGVKNSMEKPSTPKNFNPKIFETKPIFRRNLVKTDTSRVKKNSFGEHHRRVKKEK